MLCVYSKEEHKTRRYKVYRLCINNQKSQAKQDQSRKRKGHPPQNWDLQFKKGNKLQLVCRIGLFDVQGSRDLICFASIASYCVQMARLD